MNCKRFLIASLVVFAAWVAARFVTDTIILGSTYESLKHVWRPDVMEKMWISYALDLPVALLFTYISSRAARARASWRACATGSSCGSCCQFP